MFALVGAVSARASLVVKTNQTAALTAALSIDPDDWLDEFGALMDRIRPWFARYEPARHAASLMLGLLSNLERKNCWTIAELRGDVTPYGLQNMLSRASWDHDAVAAGIEKPWSNGQVEGQVHRLKLLKRQMYGRSGFLLLRRRVLPFHPGLEITRPSRSP